MTLAGDADRSRAIVTLRDAAVEGRLTLDEFADRVELPAPSRTSRNVCGTVTILVPRGVEVSVDGGGPFGTREIDLPDTGPVGDAPRLRIRTSGAGGTLRVKSSRAH